MYAGTGFFISLCSVFSEEKSNEHSKNTAVVDYGIFGGRAAPPLLEKHDRAACHA
jgi:hypothetical protein